MAQGDIGRRVRIARETMAPGKLRIADLARALDVSHARVSGWERGKHDPPNALIPEIAKALGVSAKYLVTGAKPERLMVGEPLYPYSYASIEIPYGGYVPAGDWSDPFDTENLVSVEAKFDGPGRFACRIEGDSMYPFLKPEDLAVFQEFRTRRPVIGQVVLARRRQDNFVTVKELVHDGERFRLSPVNKAHEEDDFAEWEAVGFLVGFERKVGERTRTEYAPTGLRVADPPGI